MISETLLSNGGIIEKTDYEYTDGLLVREDVRFEIDGDVIQTRTLRYDDDGRLIMAETIDPSNAELLETESRVYSESGWVSTVSRGNVTTTIATELNENQQVARFTSTVSAGSGSITRITTQTFDENDQRLTRQRFKQNDLLVETRYTNFITIDGLIHDRLYQWDVFFDATAY